MFLILNATLYCLSWKCLIMQYGCKIGTQHTGGSGWIIDWKSLPAEDQPEHAGQQRQHWSQTLEGTARGGQDEAERVFHREADLDFLSREVPDPRPCGVDSRYLNYPGVQTTIKENAFSNSLGKEKVPEGPGWCPSLKPKKDGPRPATQSGWRTSHLAAWDTAASTWL